MQMRSYFIVIYVDPNTAPKITQVRLHANAFLFHCNPNTGPKITQIRLHANAFLFHCNSRDARKWDLKKHRFAFM